MNFVKKNTFSKLGYIFTNFDLCFKKKYYLRQKYVLPYQHLFKIDNLIPQKKINFKIIANTESVKINFNFNRNNSVNDYNFIEKSYFSKNGIFYINEIFDRTVDNFSLYNQFSSNLFDLDIKIFFKTFRYNIFYPGRIYSNPKKISKKKCIIISTMGKTGSTTLLNTFSNLNIPVVKYEKFKEYFGTTKLKRFEFINYDTGIPFIKKRNIEIRNNKTTTKEKRSRNLVDLIDYYNVVNKFEKNYKKKIYIFVFRNVENSFLSAHFHKNGFFYNKEKISDKEIMNNLKKEKSEYYRRYDKWIKLLFQTYNLKLNNFKKKDNFFYFQNKKSEFYILNLDNLNNFIKSFTKTFVKKKVIRKDSNIAKNKAYSKTYQRIKKKSNFLKKFNNHNFVYLKKIHKKLNM